VKKTVLGRIAVLHMQMHGLSICLSVCHVTVVSPAKMAESIKKLFGLRTWVGQGTTS